MSHRKDYQSLGLIWLLTAIHDLIWLSLDRTIPPWDQSNHLTGSLNHLHALQNARFFDGDWWVRFWQLSGKYPPLTYILTAPFQWLFGVGPEQATLVNLLYLALLMISVYGLGRRLFNGRVGVWAAGLCTLFPIFYVYRLDYLLDTGATAFTAACFTSLTIWWGEKGRSQQWRWAIIFGLCVGFALMTKQNSLFFLFFPLVWMGGRSLWRGHWGRIAQLVLSGLVSVPIWGPWYRTNWIFLFSTAETANTAAAVIEGDPPLNTLAAWTYYGEVLPLLVSWPLIIVPLLGLLIYCRPWWRDLPTRQGLAWLSFFLVSNYLVCSAIVNKDLRYPMPALPVLAVVMAVGLVQWRAWLKGVRWVAVGGAIALLLISLYPIPGAAVVMAPLPPILTKSLNVALPAPIAAVINQVVETTPYLRSTLGVIPNTGQVNHNTVNYYGNRAGFQVYGRELGGSAAHLQQDYRSHVWFLTQNQNLGNASPEQGALGEVIRNDPDFQTRGEWRLTDGTVIQLHQRREPPVRVIDQGIGRDPRQRTHRITLQRVTVPAVVPPGAPVPIRYEWTGPWVQLEQGEAIVTWRGSGGAMWTHDHGIGLGNLHSGNPPAPNRGFRVVESLAMLPPADLPPDTYRLTVTYLNRSTGQAHSLTVPDTMITIDRAAAAVPAPELDYVTQLHHLAQGLPLGWRGLEPLFLMIGRINQYDPIQDYLGQTVAANTYRLRQDPKNLSYLYPLALARALQENAPATLAVMERAVAIAPQIPMHHAYVAFLHLYLFQPGRGEEAIAPALVLAPDQPIFQALDGLAALLQGNVVKAWRVLMPLRGVDLLGD